MKQSIFSRPGRLAAYLLLPDLLATFAAFILAYEARISSEFIPYYQHVSFGDYLRMYLMSVVVFLLIFYGVGLYDRRNLFWGAEEYDRVIRGCAYYAVSIVLLSFFIREPFASRGWLIANWAFSIIFLCAGRALFRQYLKRLAKAGHLLDRVLLLGVSEGSINIAQRLEQTGMVKVVGFLDDYSPLGTEIMLGRKVLGPARAYKRIAAQTGANLVILIPHAVSWEAKSEILRPSSGPVEPELQIASEAGDLNLMSMRVSFRGGVPLLRFQSGYAEGLDSIFKIALDYVLCLALLVLTAPVMLVITAVLLVQGGGPVIERVRIWGKNGKAFVTYKFRTGAASATVYRSFRKTGQPSIQGRQLKSVERFLFQTGLDKLPQLFNVLAGKMSLVGPRTIPTELSNGHEKWLPVVLAVKPGIIGNWALKETADHDQEISLTVYYVRNWSIWLDIAILGQTAFEIARTRFRSRIIAKPGIQLC